MQSFKLLTSDINDTLRKLKSQRAQDIKEIKTLYKELQEKQGDPFGKDIQRIAKNMQFYKETQYKGSMGSVNAKQVAAKHEGNLRKINQEIIKLEKVIKNGCGSVIQKPASSRIRAPSSLTSQQELSEIRQQDSGLEPSPE